MNSKKRVIQCRDLTDTSEEEILENLSAQDITEVRKIRVQRDGCRINTGTIILTFGLPVLPTSVKIGFLRVKVDAYIPNPLQCFKCQRYGHHRMMGTVVRNLTVLTMTEITVLSPTTAQCGKGDTGNLLPRG